MCIICESKNENSNYKKLQGFKQIKCGFCSNITGIINSNYFLSENLSYLKKIILF